MNDKTLFLAWQDKARTRQWFPVGRLDASETCPRYRFCYVHGAERARAESGFEPLFDFPDLHQCYESRDLFPLFKNRVLTPGRDDFQSYLRMLDLPDKADPMEILAVDGGYRATDSFEVFPKIERRQDGAFRCRFFLHGWRHVNQASQDRLGQLRAGEKLHVTLELNNPTGVAVQLQTEDYFMMGWAPRYLVPALLDSMAKAPAIGAEVVRVNPIPAPSKQRLLVELRGRWPDKEPMVSGDFAPLAK